MRVLCVIRREGLIWSLPVRGAWVEIASSPRQAGLNRSLPVRGAWVEIAIPPPRSAPAGGSLPVRGAWVEIPQGRYEPFLG